MTDRLAAVQGRIATIRQLGSVVNAMRGIAGARAMQGRALLPAAQAYAETVRRAIRQARALPGAPAQSPTGSQKGRPVLILFGAEQGFAGAFPDQMIDILSRERDGCDIFLIGQRTALLAEQRGIRSMWKTAVPSHADGLASLATEIVDALYACLGEAAGPVPVRLVHPQWTHVDGMRIVRRSLLPLAGEAEPVTGALPIANLEFGELMDSFAQEYVFAALCEAACEAFAAENEIRATTMATAKTHIDEKLTALEAEERLTRQEEMTAEVIELAAGARHIPGAARPLPERAS